MTNQDKHFLPIKMLNSVLGVVLSQLNEWILHTK